MKDAYWLQHDSNARNDLKMVKLRKACGLEGVGLFWCVVEMLREANGYKLPIEDIESICYDLRTDEKVFEKLFESGLLVKKNKIFFSESLLKRMERLDEIKNKRSESGRIGGQIKASKCLANAKQVLSKSEANLKQNLAITLHNSTEQDSTEQDIIKEDIIDKNKYKKTFLIKIAKDDLDESIHQYFDIAIAFHELFKKILNYILYISNQYILNCKIKSDPILCVNIFYLFEKVLLYFVLFNVFLKQDKKHLFT